MEKYSLLLSVLRSLQEQEVLKHFVLVGSWCLSVYRYMYDDSTLIPATRTMDADILIPRRLPSRLQVDIQGLMEDNGFITQADYPSGFHRFVHPDLNIEFLTEAGAKSDVSVHRFKQLGITVQELRYMSIPLQYKMPVRIEDIDLTIPEPEAFTLHKLIVCGLRKDTEKAAKDLEAAAGLMMFFEDKENHMNRLWEIYNGFPKGWRSKIDVGFKTTKIEGRVKPSS
ncbi:MAG: GSU2403 family nucleotidyltransferase fold protein [Myxococcota bacterium]|nr:GSU2403 family nucleotidyltransferase fold protein [Myxococcota bacterium]